MSYFSTLTALKTRSMRRGIWYRVLNRLERAQVDLTVKVVKKVRSPFLARVLDVIIGKLSDALQSRVSKIVKSIGFTQTLKLSRIAQSWGNKSARIWAQDSRFARFLAIMDLNSSHGLTQDC